MTRTKSSRILLEVETPNGRLDRYSLYGKTRTIKNDPPTSVMLPSGQTVDARMLFARPIYKEECLDLAYAGPSKKESLNEYSKLIDAIYLVREAHHLNQQYHLFPGNEWVVNYIATYYYEYGARFDRYLASLLVYLIESLRIPLDTKVFPKGEFDSEGAWYTLRDFLMGIGNCPPLPELVAQLKVSTDELRPLLT